MGVYRSTAHRPGELYCLMDLSASPLQLYSIVTDRAPGSAPACFRLQSFNFLLQLQSAARHTRHGSTLRWTEDSRKGREQQQHSKGESQHGPPKRAHRCSRQRDSNVDSIVCMRAASKAHLQRWAKLPCALHRLCMRVHAAARQLRGFQHSPQPQVNHRHSHQTSQAQTGLLLIWRERRIERGPCSLVGCCWLWLADPQLTGLTHDIFSILSHVVGRLLVWSLCVRIFCLAGSLRR